MGKFKGFKTLRYPTYSVVTPQTGGSYRVRLLNVGEITAFKESAVTRNKLAGLLNDLIWSVTEESPTNIKNKTDFINNTTIRDRDALIYGIYHCTYGNEKTYNVPCNGCGNEQTLKVDLERMFSMEAYPGGTDLKASYQVATVANPLMEKDPVMENAVENSDENKGSLISKVFDEDNMVRPPDDMPLEMAKQEDTYNEYFEWLEYKKTVNETLIKKSEIKKDNIIEMQIPKTELVFVDADDTTQEDIFCPVLSKIIKFKLDSSIGNVTVYVKETTLREEAELANNLSLTTQQQLNMAVESLSIYKIEEYDEHNVIVQTISDREDIMEALQLLPVRDRNKISEVYAKYFGKYRMNLGTEWDCRQCGQRNELELDPLNQFFRAAGII